MKNLKPTSETYGELQRAYDFFNQELFGGGIPNCLITLQRKRGAYGYFSGRRFTSRKRKKLLTDEIALNPVHFGDRTDEEVLSTLCHEMVHLWQQYKGIPGRGRYQNWEWADKMEELGLCPSATGMPGGKRTGDHVSHYVVKGGAFQVAYQKLQEQGFVLPWADGFADDQEVQKGSTREKYTCPECGLNAWAKPEISLICGACDEEMVPEEKEIKG